MSPRKPRPYAVTGGLTYQRPAVSDLARTAILHEGINLLEHAATVTIRHDDSPMYGEFAVRVAGELVGYLDSSTRGYLEPDPRFRHPARYQVMVVREGDVLTIGPAYAWIGKDEPAWIYTDDPATHPEKRSGKKFAPATVEASKVKGAFPVAGTNTSRADSMLKVVKRLKLTEGETVEIPAVIERRPHEFGQNEAIGVRVGDDVIGKLWGIHAPAFGDLRGDRTVPVVLRLEVRNLWDNGVRVVGTIWSGGGTANWSNIAS